MSIQEVLSPLFEQWGITLPVVVFILLTVVQITPIKINPWSAFGNMLNGNVLKKLDEHIRIDDERNADAHRVQILKFNREILHESDPSHFTQEDFIEILSEIDFYEDYCKTHLDYKNNRAVLAIQNIKREYKERLERHEFG